MENKQSPQQQSSELNASRLTRSKHREVRSTGTNPVLKILKHRPWLIWSGVWLFLVASAAIAAFSLTNINHMEHAGPTAPIAAEKPEKSSHGSSMTLWLLGAVAFTFAAGMVISKRRLNRSSPPRRLRHRTRHSVAPKLTHRREPRRPLREHPPVPTPIEPLPAETESLAEMMDIRKHRSLDSILRKP